MGISTLLILICHAPAHINDLPPQLRFIMTNCAYGVDIFLFLSGMGLCYSLSNIDMKTDLWQWYKKRYIRLLMPCLIVQLLFIYKQDILHHLMFFTGISFFAAGDGFWFIDMLIPLYLMAPVLYLVSEKRYGLYIIGLLTILCFCFCMIKIENSLITHTKEIITRVPSFLGGIMMSKSIKTSKTVNIFLLVFVVSIVLPLMAHFTKTYLSQDIMAAPFYMPLLLISFCILLSISNIIWGGVIWRFLGKISLESYLLNVSITFILDRMLNSYCPSYIIYLISIFTGVIIAYLIHILTTLFIKIADNIKVCSK